MSIANRRPAGIPLLLAAAWLLLACCHPAVAQDHVRGAAEPLVASIDPSKLTYDILVDSSLAQDDPANRKFRTVQAAYAAAAPGTEQKPTVIGIKPDVYLLPGGAPRTPSLRITKNYITLLGLTNNRRAVVLADNRGLMQGAEDNGYILDVDAVGFTLRNLTVINYCNTDYEYPGDPRKNLKKRSDVVTQAVALQAAGDKHVYDNVALLGRLDTMFLRTTRSWFRNVYIEGTDDWMGGGQISVWEDSTLVYPKGSGVMSASNVVFRNCTFVATGGMQFYKAEYGGAARPNVLINSIVPVASAKTPVAWVRGKAKPRPAVYSLTYRNKDAKGNRAVIYDSDLGKPAFTYSRELTEKELGAYNTWNLLRATPAGVVDNWDPAGVRKQYEGAGEQVFRMFVTGSDATIRTGGAGTPIGVTITPLTAADAAITWSTTSDLVSLSQNTGSQITVTARNDTGNAQWVPITARVTNGFHVTAYVRAEPRFIDPPAVTTAPAIAAPRGGKVMLSYRLALGGHQDQSLVTWSLCNDAVCTEARDVAVSRGDQPLKELTLLPGFAGKFLRASVQPKHDVSDPGAAVQVISRTAVTTADIPSSSVSLNFRNLVTRTSDTYTSGLWTVLGPWTVAAEEELLNGYGARSGNGAASLLYQDDVPRGDMQVDLLMTPDKTAGQGFSVPGTPTETGPRSLFSDVYIKYDPRTKNGYALRFWRTTQSATKCMFQLYRIENGIGAPLNDQQVLSGVFRPDTTMRLRVVGDRLTVDASNNVNTEKLHLEGRIAPNQFGGAGVYWPGGSANAYSRFDVSNSPR